MSWGVKMSTMADGVALQLSQVFWLNMHTDCHPKDHWDTAMFQELILKDFPEWDGDHPKDPPRIVMVAGRFHANDVGRVNDWIGMLAGVVVVVHSDEESLFPWQELEHPNMRRWVMTPTPDTKPVGGVRFIGEGWPTGTPEILARLPERFPMWDVSFAGQVTHPRRDQMMASIADIVQGSVVTSPTTSFAGGMPRRTYLYQLADTKLAPCPSGPVTADSFRVYEALEAGCVPILDGVDGRGRPARDFWRLILGAHPLPVIDDWADLPVLVDRLLGEWDDQSRIVGSWWGDRKALWVDQMAADVASVS